VPEPPPNPPQVDEGYLKEWIALGFGEMAVYLARYAQFDRWLVEHPRAVD